MVARRKLLHALGVGLATPFVANAQQHPPAKPSQGEGGWQFFTARDGEFITAAVDRLIPPDRWPGAAQAGVPVYIDRQLAGDYGAGARMYLQGPIAPGTPQQGYQLGLTPAQLYRESLDGIHAELKGRAFGQRGADAQDEFLRALEAGERTLGSINSAIFFETLLANTIEGFFADPMYGGNRNMVGWRMIGFPGAYAAYVNVVAQHGIDYDRPPISIASGGGHGHGGKNNGNGHRT